MILSFNDLNAYQNSLQKYGIGGNDLAVFVNFKPVYRYMTGWQNIRNKWYYFDEETASISWTTKFRNTCPNSPT